MTSRPPLNRRYSPERVEALLAVLEATRQEALALDEELTAALARVGELQARRSENARRMEALQGELLEGAVKVGLQAEPRPVPVQSDSGGDSTGFERGGRRFELWVDPSHPDATLAVARWEPGEDRNGVREAVVRALLEQGGGPVSAGRLLQAVAHLSSSENAARILLGEMVRDGVLLRPRRGLYSLPRPVDLGFDDLGREVEM